VIKFYPEVVAKMSNIIRTGLALGGGAARGISHIGVIQVLEENGIVIDAVAGTSMGAIVGAIYLMEGNARRLVRRMYDFFESEAFKAAQFDVLAEERQEEDVGWLEGVTGLIRRGMKYSLSVTRQSIISREIFEDIVEELVPPIRIEDLPKPFAAISLDAVSGKEVIWTEGPLRDALWATSAIPGFFPPLEKDGMVLVDGAWTNAVPLGPARELGADQVIAVDISREVEEVFEYKRGISLILRSAVLASKRLRELQLEGADVLLRPDVGDVHWADFEDPEELIQKGRDAALVNLDQIRALARKPGVFTPFQLLGRIRSALGRKKMTGGDQTDDVRG
jgi:NTE family protein